MKCGEAEAETEARTRSSPSPMLQEGQDEGTDGPSRQPSPGFEPRAGFPERSRAGRKRWTRNEARAGVGGLGHWERGEGAATLYSRA